MMLTSAHDRTPVRTFTAEQSDAIERRSGELLLDANAGSGKTSVLVERFARSVLDDGIEPARILAITFTEKAAAELRDRIRSRLRELGDPAAARATEDAPIGTIHGFCARLLRAHALAAGLDPGFQVLDEDRAGALADAALDSTIEELAAAEAGVRELIACWGVPALREALLRLYGQLRSGGQTSPTLPAIPEAEDAAGPAAALLAAARAAAAELDAVPDPGVRVRQALERLSACSELLAAQEGDTLPWPAELDALTLGNGGSALATDACRAYAEALARFRSACEHRAAVPTLAAIDVLLGSFGQRYDERKRRRGAVDFDDLELLTRDLLVAQPALAARYRERFEAVMVDELQDTNRVQLELVELIAGRNLFTVGDALQSIYGFRHAEVELFERRRARLAAVGGHATLRTNFRSRREILDAINIAFATELGPDSYKALVAGRGDPPAADPPVELLIAEKGADWAGYGQDELAAPWRLAEAAALAERVSELLRDGAAPRDAVVLTRAGTDLRVYERALEDRGIPTYVIGGRGYWAHPQVVDLVGYVRALANPLDQESFYGVLASPLVGVSLDALVLIGAAARACGVDPWTAVREGSVPGLAEDDVERLARFAEWFGSERSAAARLGAEELIDRVVAWSGYDLTMLALPGGERRLANVRKLMRLAREHEAVEGRDLRSFVELLRTRSGAATEGIGAGPAAVAVDRESEAPVEGEALDAVRLMTIHRSKGLEFEIVCVADLGRGPRYPADLVRIGRDGRIGLRLAQPGTGAKVPALGYQALGEEQAAADAAEERRLFFVAMTRARERLVLSGAARFDRWTAPPGGGPISWIAPALIPDIAVRLAAAGASGGGVVERVEGEWAARIAYRLIRPGDGQSAAACVGPGAASAAAAIGDPGAVAGSAAPGSEPPYLTHRTDLSVPIPDHPLPPVATLSYSSLREYRRCGYRFYLERVVGLPPEDEPRPAGGVAPGWTAAQRGVVAHAVLERLDFLRAVPPSADAVSAAAARQDVPAPTPAEAEEIVALAQAFCASDLCTRLGRAAALAGPGGGRVAREQRFAFELEPGGVLVSGVFDVAVRLAGGLLVIDYKSDRLQGADPVEVVERQYVLQRLIYALAALESGAASVEVVHLFLERADAPVTAAFTASDRDRLRSQLLDAARGLLAHEFPVAAEPWHGICAGCSGAGGLCSWPVELTRREAPDRLF